MNKQDFYHIILVEPAGNLNIGAVARAMDNFGFKHLHLVAPDAYSRTEAERSACWAKNILDSIQIHKTFAEALAPMERVIGFTARHGKTRTTHVAVDDWLLEQQQQPICKTALVFGPEDNGLRAEHVELCSTLVRIPTSTENQSLNLAQAVLIALYEISKGAFVAPKLEEDAPANWASVIELEKKIDGLLQASGFILGPQSSPAADTLKAIFREHGLGQREMRIVQGLFSKLLEKLGTTTYKS